MATTQRAAHPTRINTYPATRRPRRVVRRTPPAPPAAPGITRPATSAPASPTTSGASRPPRASTTSRPGTPSRPRRRAPSRRRRSSRRPPCFLAPTSPSPRATIRLPRCRLLTVGPQATADHGTPTRPGRPKPTRGRCAIGASWPRWIAPCASRARRMRRERGRRHQRDIPKLTRCSAAPEQPGAATHPAGADLARTRRKPAQRPPTSPMHLL
mmetsp:Transcript_21053/g.59172  ORF Transcript_21053/g.59172 Transcript_21053/m.59172 type:complete len:213 (-) Transcript_21053:28-666(-)